THYEQARGERQCAKDWELVSLNNHLLASLARLRLRTVLPARLRFTNRPLALALFRAASPQRTREPLRPAQRLGLRLYARPGGRGRDVARARERRARRRPEDRRLRRRRRPASVSRRAYRRHRRRYRQARRRARAFVRVIHIECRIEEHISTRIAGVDECRFFSRGARRNEADTPTGALAERHARSRTATHARGLILIHVPLTVHILRHQRIVAVEEQPAAIRQVARLVERLTRRIRCPRRNARRERLTSVGGPNRPRARRVT